MAKEKHEHSLRSCIKPTFSSPSKKGKEKKNTRRQNIKTLKKNPEILHENYEYHDLNNTGVITIDVDYKRLCFYTERPYLWIDALTAFYRNKGMKASTARQTNGTTVTVADHVTIEVNDSGVIGVTGDALEDWRENDFQLIKGTIAPLIPMPVSTPSRIDPPSSSSTPLTTRSMDYQSQDIIPPTQSQSIPSENITVITDTQEPSIGPNTSAIDMEDSQMLFSNMSSTLSGSDPDMSQSLLRPNHNKTTDETVETITLKDTQPSSNDLNTTPSQPTTGDLHMTETQTDTPEPPSPPPVLCHCAKAPTISYEGENKKLRSKIIQQAAKIDDLLQRVEVNELQRKDEAEKQQLLFDSRVRDLGNELSTVRNELRIKEKEFSGLQADLKTTFNKNLVLMAKLEKHEKQRHNASLPQSLNENSTKTTAKQQSATKQQKAIPTPKRPITPPSTTSPATKVQGKASSPPPPPPPPTVHIMYSSNGKKLAGIMKGKESRIKVTSSVYSGARVEDATHVIQNGDIPTSTDYKILGFGTNNVQTDTPQEIIYGLKNLIQTARNRHKTSKLILAGLHHRGDSNSDEQIYKMNRNIDQINCAMEAFCHQQHVGFIDINKINRSTANHPNFSVLFGDRLHFNFRGRDSMVNAMISTMKNGLSTGLRTYSSVLAERVNPYNSRYIPKF
ncbi:unnamed protein product [Owenia fusiformis]|uniref:SGNH hydrolase-type esterase domain-containing protein n=1 Tax=Owenia fusiformis TaxID=6347 RepID=A0A8S4N1R1_OWEFU|nr:unnamed protein product [Owenia fusiformis]